MFYHALTSNSETPIIRDLLWHNDNPTKALSTTDVSGDYSKYSKIYIEGRLSASNDYKISAVLEKNNTYSGGLAANSGNGTNMQFRTVKITDTNIHIANGFLCSFSGGQNNGTVAPSSNVCVITDIYGIK